MKYIFVFLFCMGASLSSLYSQGQTRGSNSGALPQSGLKKLPDNFDSSIDLPVPFIRGDTVLINADKMYPVNEIRFQLYRDMHRVIRDSVNINQVRRLIENYQFALELQKKGLDSLEIYSQRLEKVTKELNEFSIENLADVIIIQNGLRDSLSTVQDSLEGVQKNLVVANKKIRQTKHLSIASVGAALLAALVVIFD
ncbi:MAG: hypothetical protein AAGC85_17570 [Bacteroidota bacterium]